MYVSKFKNVKNANVIETDVPIDKILHLIKSGTYKDEINHAREFQKGDDEYEKIKKSIPSYTPNATFYGKRTTSNLKELSGLIYLDVEHYIKSGILNEMDFIYSYWKSFGGEGFGILIQVNGLTPDNFKQIWDHLNNYFNQFNIELDKQTKDITRQNVISYDPNIYINKECNPLDANIILRDYINDTTSVSGSTNKINYTTTTTYDKDQFIDFQQKINFNTYLDDYKGQDYVIIEEGKACRDAYIPRTVYQGNRHKWLAGYISTILFNTSSIEYNILKKFMYRLNKDHCKPPLNPNELINLIDWYYNKHIQGILNINTKNKRIWFDPMSNLSLKEKQSVVGKYNGKLRKERTINELKEVYNKLKQDHEKVTQKMVVEHSSKSLRTVKKYWKEVSD